MCIPCEVNVPNEVVFEDFINVRFFIIDSVNFVTYNPENSYVYQGRIFFFQNVTVYKFFAMRNFLRTKVLEVYVISVSPYCFKLVLFVPKISSFKIIVTLKFKSWSR